MNPTLFKVDAELKETVQFIKSRSKMNPRLGYVLGSGLGHFASLVEKPVSIPFHEIPHFAATSVAGHAGELVLGHLHGQPVAILKGRLHAYEGHDFKKVIFPVRTLAALGVKTLVVTNSAGGLKKTMRPGDFLIIRDHINLTGENPLRGPNWARGPRFVDMTEPYDKKLSDLLKKCLKKEKARVHDGVYVGVMGPTYETAAEIRFFAMIGGGSVGMSTVSDVIAARHAGLRVVGVSCITNLGTGLSKSKLSHDEVKDVANQVEKKFSKALAEFAKSLLD